MPPIDPSLKNEAHIKPRMRMENYRTFLSSPSKTQFSSILNCGVEDVFAKRPADPLLHLMFWIQKKLLDRGIKMTDVVDPKISAVAVAEVCVCVCVCVCASCSVPAPTVASTCTDYFELLLKYTGNSI